MKRSAIALALLLPATAVFASGDAAVSADVEAQITALLTAEGYEVRSIEMEDGQYEAYAMRDGARFEIYLDDSLTIVRVAEDD
ncbi:PepSY domain-containing protein [Nioella aestuarii]|uniref:PepSY domain-containing protein n=1 Tax=Nioella aestuarii TaxID=1662864 RepID=UPI003D7F873D